MVNKNIPGLWKYLQTTIEAITITPRKDGMAEINVDIYPSFRSTIMRFDQLLHRLFRKPRWRAGNLSMANHLELPAQSIISAKLYFQ